MGPLLGAELINASCACEVLPEVFVGTSVLLSWTRLDEYPYFGDDVQAEGCSISHLHLTVYSIVAHPLAPVNGAP